jgi:hypothetical protein
MKDGQEFEVLVVDDLLLVLRRFHSQQHSEMELAIKREKADFGSIRDKSNIFHHFCPHSLPEVSKSQKSHDLILET